MIATLFAEMDTWWPSASTSDVLFNVAWVALGLATVILLLMLVTGHGNARHVRISLMISIIAHCALALCTDKIPIAAANIHVKSAEPTFEIDQLVFTAIDDQSNRSPIPMLPPGTLWPPPRCPKPSGKLTKMPPSELPETPREEQLPAGTRTGGAVPTCRMTAEDKLEIPRAESSVPETERTADGTQLDNYEETVESRPDVDIPATRSGERRREDQGLAKSEIERENRRGRTEDPTADLRESRRMEVADATTDPVITIGSRAEFRGGQSPHGGCRRDVAGRRPRLPAPPSAAKKWADGLPQSKAFSRRRQPRDHAPDTRFRRRCRAQPPSGNRRRRSRCAVGDPRGGTATDFRRCPIAADAESKRRGPETNAAPPACPPRINFAMSTIASALPSATERAPRPKRR